MPKEYFTSALDASYEQLEVMDGIKFTPREIDIIACILGGRGRKSTASLLEISEKTVETHTRNIMRKLECNSQESIRNRIEKSEKLVFIKSHYLNLLIESSFKQHLRNISTLTKELHPICLLLHQQEHGVNSLLISQLEKHLKLAGITFLLKGIEKSNNESHFTKIREAKEVSSVLYIMPKSNSQSANQSLHLEIVKNIQAGAKNGENIIFIFLSKEDIKNFPKASTSVRYISFSDEREYYFVFFELLNHMIPQIDLNSTIAAFKEEYAVVSGGSEHSIYRLESQTCIQSISAEDKGKSTEYKSTPTFYNSKNSFWSLYRAPLKFFKLRKGWFIAGSVVCLFAFSTFLITFFSTIGTLNKNGETQGLSSVRSDLVLPTESVFLNRADLMSQIEDKLKGQEGIKTIALVGTGGAGKTTLARQYARQQKANFIWEFNAETQESLKESFENLAQALSKTEEDKKTLKEIQKLKNPTKQKEEIFHFVKDRLRSHENWFLIFDNMEKFSDIQTYLPKDGDTWGQGKVILTTRDSNIQNNKHINDIILVDALNEGQKFQLFNKIMSTGNSHSLSSSQEEQTKEFLKEIPSFPLDVSLAAYYIKATKIPYRTYLESLNQYDKDFIQVQENLLKESGEYTKTRYNILALSLEHLLQTHQDFGDLLLLISLVDSQEIPRELLSSYKGESVVGNFIYNLEKYSLAMPSSPSSSLSNSTLSLHRSMQEIILKYLTNTLKPAKRETAPKEISNMLASSISRAVEKEDIERMKLLARHGGVFLKHAHLLDVNSRGSLGAELGRTYFYLGDYKRAAELFQISLPYIQNQTNENSLKTAKVLDTLGVIYRELGNYQEAEKVLEKGLAIYEKHHPQNYKEIAHTLTHLGSIHKELGNDNKARNVLEKSFPIYEKCPPKNDKENLWTLVHLGMVHRDLGNYEKAISVLEQSLHIYKTHFPENYVRIASVLASLGNVYNLAGDYAKAKNLLEQSLAIYKKHFSEHDRGFASTAAYLGNTQRELGNYKEAKELFQKSLMTYENYYGKDHIEVARLMKKLEDIYLLEGQLEPAEDYLQKALETFQKINHPEKILILEELSKVQTKRIQKEP